MDAGGVVRDLVFWAAGVAAVVTAWRVFRTDSMVRAAYWLMASFVAVGIILVLLGADFLGLVLLLMMAGEMTIMAVFMVMFMMNPAGLNPMVMVHQHRTSIIAGVVAFLGLAAVGVFGRFPEAPVASTADTTARLGMELLGDSMLVFETAGATLLATMIGAIAIANSRGRYGSADEGSVEPTVATATSAGAAPEPHDAMQAGSTASEPAPKASAMSTTAPAAPATEPAPAEDEHAGHTMPDRPADPNATRADAPSSGAVHDMREPSAARRDDPQADAEHPSHRGPNETTR